MRVVAARTPTRRPNGADFPAKERSGKPPDRASPKHPVVCL